MNAYIYNEAVTDIRVVEAKDERWFEINMKGGSHLGVWVTEEQAKQLMGCLVDLYPSLKQPEPPLPETPEEALEKVEERVMAETTPA